MNTKDNKWLEEQAYIIASSDLTKEFIMTVLETAYVRGSVNELSRSNSILDSLAKKRELL